MLCVRPLNLVENVPLVAPCAPSCTLLPKAAVSPHSKPTSVGAVVAPEKEPDRVASVELGSIPAAVVTVAAGSSPPALSPDESQSWYSYKSILEYSVPLGLPEE